MAKCITEREENLIKEIEEKIQTDVRNRKATLAELDKAVIKRAKEALRYKRHVERIRSCHEELIEAQIRLIEAVSDVAGLEARNRDIVQQQAEEREKVRVIEQESKRVKDAARVALETVNELFSNPEMEDLREDLTKYSNQNSLEAIEAEIAAEQSKLDYMHANNPNAIRDFEKRQGEIDALTMKIALATDKLQKIAHKITKTRDKWEPQLDELVAHISDAFAYNFEQIGCAGEVSVHKDDDFDLWSIQIKVKFRYGFPLSIVAEN